MHVFVLCECVFVSLCGCYVCLQREYRLIELVLGLYTPQSRTEANICVYHIYMDIFIG